MILKEILSLTTNVLISEERDFFFDQGYLCLSGIVPGDLLSRMRTASDAAVARTRSLAATNMEFSLEPDHTAEAPRPSRLFRASEEDSAFWEFASGSPLVELAADLVGPDVRYREAYINYKCPHGDVPVHWHQDFIFFPHTNRSIITTITYLEDVTPDMGPLMVIPGSHKREIFDHYDNEGTFVGRVLDADLPRAQPETAMSLPGPAGTVIVIDGCMLHSSKRNDSGSMRPALVIGFSAADAFPYTPMSPQHSDSHTWQIIRGRPADYAHHEPIRVKVPPPWTPGDFRPIFEMQQESDE
jgi:ectoine hydroxylase